MRSSLRETTFSDRLDGGAPPACFIWALDKDLAAQALQAIAPEPGALQTLPSRGDWEDALSSRPVGVLVATTGPEQLPGDDLQALMDTGARCILLLPECDDRTWRRMLIRGFEDVLAPPFKGLDLGLLFSEARFPLPLDRRLADLDARVRSRIEFRIPADLRYVAPSAGFIARLAREHGFHPRVWLENLPLALDEAISNAVRHGCGQDSALEVKVEVWFSHDVMKIRIEDPGNGFDPDALIDPASEEGLHRGGGRGVLLMRELMDRVEFQDGGRVVLLHARRSASE